MAINFGEIYHHSLGHAILALPRMEVPSIVIASGASTPISSSFQLIMLEVNNTTGSAGTVSIADVNGSVIVPTTTLFNNSTLTYKSEYGRLMTGGLTWTASISGMVGYVVGINLTVDKL